MMPYAVSDNPLTPYPSFRALFVKNLRSVFSAKTTLLDPPPIESAFWVDERRLEADSTYSYNVTSEELFDLFGKFGPIR